MGAGAEEPLTLPIRGRAAEIGVIHASLARLGDGMGSVVVLTGDAGIGKSRLLRWACDEARSRGINVHAGASEEWERDRPFALLSGALDLVSRSDDARRRAIADQLIGSAPTAESDHARADRAGSLRFKVQDAIVDLVERFSLERPQLVAFDDVQWADPASLATVVAMCRRTRDLALGVVIAMRPHPSVPPPFDGSLDRTGAHRVELGPLDDDSVVELVDDHVGAGPGDHLRAQLGGAGGNPFFVIEVVRTLHREGHLTLSEGQVESDVVGMPPTVHQAILRRVRSLSNSAVEVLRGGAMLGGRFELDVLADVLGADPSAVQRDVAEAMSVGLVVDADPHLRIRHDLIREAVYADTPVAVRRSMHRRAAAAATRVGLSPVTIVGHLALSRDDDLHEGTGEPAALLRAAAAELAGGDPAAAADLLGRAGATFGARGCAAAQLAADRALMLTASGRLDEAERVGRAALATSPPPAVAGRLHLVLAEGALLRGDTQTAISDLDRARRLNGLGEAHRADIDAHLAWARLQAFDLVAAERAAGLAERWAVRHGDDRVLATALAVRCRLAAYAAKFARAVELGRAAVAAARSAPEALHETPELQLGLACSNAGLVDDAIKVLEEGRRRAERAGEGWTVARHHAALVLVGLHAGGWDDALAEADAARSLYAEGVTRSSIVEVEAMAGIMHFRRGEHDEATGALTRARAELGRAGADESGVVWMWWLRAMIAEAERDLPAAVRRLARAFDLAVDRQVHSVNLWWGPDLTRLAMAVGDGRLADRVVGQLEGIATRSPSPPAAAAAARGRGLVSEDPEVLAHAIELTRRVPRPLDLVHALEAAAAVPDAQRDRAIEQLDDALTVADRIGALYDGARIRARLRALGVRSGARGPRRRPTSGPGSLTPTERRVLALVGEGLTNAQIADHLFVSRRTAETHVTNLYRKLEVEGRIALARRATEI